MKNNFAIFIMVHGRPNRMWTYATLRKSGYTGKIFLVADNLDRSVEKYREAYGSELLVFDKNEAAKNCDPGDNSGDMRSTLFAVNKIPDLARKLGIKYFMIMCDDYVSVSFSFNKEKEFYRKEIKNLDEVLDTVIEFYKSTPALTIAFAQGGDFLGGVHSQNARPRLLRKSMNTFLCSTERPFKFMGRLNEDVTTYVNLGNKGELFFTFTDVMIVQKPTQSETKGLTDVYIDYGTYVKSFFSVMYNPSCVKVASLTSKHKRIHHLIKWANAVPRIVSEQHRKAPNNP